MASEATGVSGVAERYAAALFDLADERRVLDEVASDLRDLRTMLAMTRYGPGDWRPPIVATVAATGDGIDDVVAAISKHRAWLTGSGELHARRQARARDEISAIALGELRRREGGLPGESRLDELAERVCTGKLDPYSAADELIAG